jgi:trimethylamine--corrinoid protein Co-methyltransferase
MSDSKTIDAQTGYEGALTTLVTALSGANYIHDAAGLMEFAMVASYEKYIIDNEIIGMVLRVLRGIEVTPETIATDLIKRVGPAGNFLREPHTIKHMRSEFFFPQLSDREPREDWLANGGLDTRQRANAFARQILAEHQPEPLQSKIDQELHARFDLVVPQ